ncbi:MAG: HD domain-containing protein [bacterium]|nr:HD domain-containing protein [bacterium]
MDTFEKIKEEAKKMLVGINSCHEWEHTERVYNLAIKMGKKENADLEILGLAAVLHDIARKEQDESNGKICHAERGAILAKEILERYGFQKEKREDITHCIEAHRYRNEKKPETKEAKILYDADKLDAIGAIGIGRAFSFAGHIGAKIHNKNVDPEKTEAYSTDDTAYREYLVKLKHIKDKMLTAEGKRIAEERHKFMEHFFDRLNKEVDGEI